MKILKKIGKWILILLLGLISVMLMLLLIIRISSTGIEESFLDEHGNVISNSIAVHEDMIINGAPQRIIIRGMDIDNPVLLVVHGGPGQPLPITAYKINQTDLEDLFTVCYWEQRGSGHAYKGQIPDSTITLNQIVEDGIELTNYLKNKFKKDKIYIQGESWGTTVSAYMIQKNPELFQAYIGIGQMANQSLSEQMSYDFVLSEATNHNDEESINQLTAIGRPPYPNKSNMEMLEAVVVERSIVMKYAPSRYTIGPRIIMGTLLDNGMTFKEKLSIMNNPVEYYPSAKILWPTCFNMNLMLDIPEWKIPVYILQGDNDHFTETSLAKEYFDLIQAPSKKWFLFENATHPVHFEYPEKYRSIIINNVLKN